MPTVFRWHRKREFKCHFRFSFSHDIEKQIWVLLFVFHFRPNFEKRFCTSYFVFRFRITLKNGYEFQFSFFVFASLWKTDMKFVFPFSFSHYLEKRIWIWFLVFLSLWKTDLNLVCHFCTIIWSPGHPAHSPPRKLSFLSSFPGYNKLLHHKLLNNWATWTGKNKTRLVNFSYKWHKKCVRDLNKAGLS